MKLSKSSLFRELISLRKYDVYRIHLPLINNTEIKIKREREIMHVGGRI
jgi:hypothetical protein